ncbi:MAG: 3-deoxy-manno-octulosonate cytidylyltransferase [Alphaproteobacteria bacterium]|nr:3-deoxy-manno-octulosonate cytidylyltransferase [Alphaproteobacteria bacterium]
MNPVIVIPARLQAVRFPGKPLADIHGTPMIVHVWRRAVAAAIGPVVVACGDREIAAAIEGEHGNAVLTEAGLHSGSDRVHAALQRVDPDGMFDVVVNVQGDLPALEPETARRALVPLANDAVDIATLGAPLAAEDAGNPNVVKAILGADEGTDVWRARTFTRHAPAADARALHHIGIYAFRRPALDRFVALPPSAGEQRERLEQLRALDDGMRIDVARVDTVPLGVDTPADLDRVRLVLAPGKPN